MRQLTPAVSATQTVALLLLQSKQTTTRADASHHGNIHGFPFCLVSICCVSHTCFLLLAISLYLTPLPCKISHFWFPLGLWLRMNLGPKGLEILGTDEMLATVWFHPKFLSSENTGPGLEKPSKSRYQGFPWGQGKFCSVGKTQPH